MLKNDSVKNPYVSGAEGRKEWNDRYFNLSQAMARWQIAFFISTAMSLLLILILAKLALQSKVQPYLVETNQGSPYAIKPLPTISPTDQRIVNFALNQFVINAKTILSDPAAQKTLLNKVYAYAANSARETLNTFFRAHNPLVEGKESLVSINIIDAMPISDHTWQITWDETKTSTTTGQVMETSRWTANLTYAFETVNPAWINENPFGLYVTQLNWSKNRI